MKTLSSYIYILILRYALDHSIHGVGENYQVPGRNESRCKHGVSKLVYVVESMVECIVYKMLIEKDGIDTINSSPNTLLCNIQINLAYV